MERVEPQKSLVTGPATCYVKLNVGGALFQTTIGTLTKADSMLRAMFSGRMEVLKDADGWVLIDRSGKHFGLLLNWLRDGEVALPDCRQEIDEILVEARYYLLQELVGDCQAWLEATRSVEKEPAGVCRIPIISTKAEAERLIASTQWVSVPLFGTLAVQPTIKLLINRHNNKYSYTMQSDDNIMKNLELFDRMALKFHDRILFVKDVGSESSEVCQWKFYGKGILKAEVCCTSIVYATDKKQTKVEFPDSKIYDEAMSILRYEDRGLCRRCGSDTCKDAERFH